MFGIFQCFCPAARPAESHPASTFRGFGSRHPSSEPGALVQHDGHISRSNDVVYLEFNANLSKRHSRRRRRGADRIPLHGKAGQTRRLGSPRGLPHKCCRKRAPLYDPFDNPCGDPSRRISYRGVRDQAPPRRAAAGHKGLDSRIPHIYDQRTQSSDRLWRSDLGRRRPHLRSLVWGMSDHQVLMAFGGPTRGVCSQILYNIADGRGRQECYQTKVVKRGRCLTTLFRQPS